MGCKHCSQTDYLLSFRNGTGDFDLRFDVENKQLDFMVSNLDNEDDELDESIDIKFCMFCGKELQEEAAK